MCGRGHPPAVGLWPPRERRVFSNSKQAKSEGYCLHHTYPTLTQQQQMSRIFIYGYSGCLSGPYITGKLLLCHHAGLMLSLDVIISDFLENHKGALQFQNARIGSLSSGLVGWLRKGRVLRSAKGIPDEGGGNGGALLPSQEVYLPS